MGNHTANLRRVGELITNWNMASGLGRGDPEPNWSEIRRKNRTWETCASHSVEGVVVSDRCPGGAGSKVLTGCLLASGFRLAQAFALAVSEAGRHLSFVAWHIPAADALFQQSPSKQLGQHAAGNEASLGSTRTSLQKGSPLTFVRSCVMDKWKPPASG